MRSYDLLSLWESLLTRDQVDAHKHTIKVSYFTSATFSTDESLSPAQRREKEFNSKSPILSSSSQALTSASHAESPERGRTRPPIP